MVTAKASIFSSLGQCLPRTCPHGLGNASGLWPRHGVYTLTLSIQRARPLGRSRTGQGLKQEECEPHLEPGENGVSGREVNGEIWAIGGAITSSSSRLWPSGRSHEWKHGGGGRGQGQTQIHCPASGHSKRSVRVWRLRRLGRLSWVSPGPPPSPFPWRREGLACASPNRTVPLSRFPC